MANKRPLLNDRRIAGSSPKLRPFVGDINSSSFSDDVLRKTVLNRRCDIVSYWHLSRMRLKCLSQFKAFAWNRRLSFWSDVSPLTSHSLSSFSKLCMCWANCCSKKLLEILSSWIEWRRGVIGIVICSWSWLCSNCNSACSNGDSWISINLCWSVLITRAAKRKHLSKTVFNNRWLGHSHLLGHYLVYCHLILCRLVQIGKMVARVIAACALKIILKKKKSVWK